MASVIAVTWVGIVATRPLKVAFPPRYACVGDAARSLIMINAAVSKPEEGWTREQVRETVRQLIVEEFGVTEFSDDSHFVDDLHMA